MKITSIIAVCLLSVTLAHAISVKLPGIFSSNMLLQRETPQKIWGWGNPNDAIVVNIGDKDYSTTVNPVGLWAVTLDPHPPGAAYQMLITAGGAPQLTLVNIAFGDLFLCSGQSNMQFSTSMVFNASTEIANANYPDLRLLTVTQNPSLTPLADITPEDGGWQATTPSSVGGPDWTYFSAVCYFFGRDVHLATGIPVGLVASDYGGTIAEAWSSNDVLHKCGYDVPDIASMSTNTGAPDPNTHTVLWNGMIEPLLTMRFQAVVWYQGESNAGNPLNYTCVFPNMIADWRAKFGLPDMHFYFVQVSTWYAGGIIPAIRGAQESGLTQPLTGMATAMDLSDWDSPYNCIHPRNKQEVGHRLFLQAMAKLYKHPEIPCENSFYKDHAVITSPDNVFSANIQFVTVYDGIHWNASLPEKGPSGFEVCEGENDWKPATAAISGPDTVVISAAVTDRKNVTKIRYAWADWPICSIYNSANLPALQFWVDVKW